MTNTGRIAPPIRKAKLFYSGMIDGRAFVNVQDESGDFARIEITRAQLRNMLIDGIRILVMDAEEGKAKRKAKP